MKTDLHGRVLLTQKQIAVIVEKLAKQLNTDYRRQTPVLVGVLNGSFIFLADLVRQLTFAPEICFIQLSSYDGTDSTGEVRVVRDINVDAKDRSVLIVEDIVDSGLTIEYLRDYLTEKEAKDIKVCTLLCRSKSVMPSYVGMQIETNKFLVGYGLDLDNQFRNFPYIMELNMEANK